MVSFFLLLLMWKFTLFSYKVGLPLRVFYSYPCWNMISNSSNNFLCLLLVQRIFSVSALPLALRCSFGPCFCSHHGSIAWELSVGFLYGAQVPLMFWLSRSCVSCSGDSDHLVSLILVQLCFGLSKHSCFSFHFPFSLVACFLCFVEKGQRTGRKLASLLSTAILLFHAWQ